MTQTSSLLKSPHTIEGNSKTLVMKTTSQTKRRQCIPVVGGSCLQKVNFICPPDYYDGCLTDESSVHQCFPKEKGISCQEDLTVKCPENFEDACLSKRSKWHLCKPLVFQTCEEGEELNCPPGFIDSCVH